MLQWCLTSIQRAHEHLNKGCKLGGMGWDGLGTDTVCHNPVATQTQRMWRKPGLSVQVELCSEAASRAPLWRITRCSALTSWPDNICSSFLTCRVSIILQLTFRWLPVHQSAPSQPQSSQQQGPTPTSASSPHQRLASSGAGETLPRPLSGAPLPSTSVTALTSRTLKPSSKATCSQAPSTFDPSLLSLF